MAGVDVRTINMSSSARNFRQRLSCAHGYVLPTVARREVGHLDGAALRTFRADQEAKFGVDRAHQQRAVEQP